MPEGGSEKMKQKLRKTKCGCLVYDRPMKALPNSMNAHCPFGFIELIIVKKCKYHEAIIGKKE